MSTVERIHSEIDALIQRSAKLLKEQKKDHDRSALRIQYESWYTLALSFIRQIVPERVTDFQSAYRHQKRKDINSETYTIEDYLMGLVVTHRGQEAFDTHLVFQFKFLGQIAILKAASDSAVALLRDIRTVLRAELFDDDLEAARELLKTAHFRSAGVICGVVLEGQLKSAAFRRSIKFTKRNVTISDLNDSLKNSSAYDVPMWRFIQRLGDIHNLCGHAGDRDPSKKEVDELITGVEKVIKEVF